MRAIWEKVELRNDRVRELLGIQFTPLDTSLLDCVESLINIAKVKPIQREGFKLQD